MRYNQHILTLPDKLSDAELAARLATIRQDERDRGVKLPLTVEAVLLHWEKTNG